MHQCQSPQAYAQMQVTCTVIDTFDMTAKFVRVLATESIASQSSKTWEQHTGQCLKLPTVAPHRNSTRRLYVAHMAIEYHIQALHDS